ncbi:unnamed protein product, partial [Allacma fusca]
RVSSANKIYIAPDEYETRFVGSDRGSVRVRARFKLGVKSSLRYKLDIEVEQNEKNSSSTNSNFRLRI